jgi:hypothetical protein
VPNHDSLHTVLRTPELRSSLTLLLATITARMRSDITAIFDPRFVTSNLDQPQPQSQSQSQPQPQPQPQPQANVDPANITTDDQRESIVEELSKPEVQELKKQLLQFYDAWKSAALTAIEDVVDCSQPGPQDQPDQTKEDKAHTEHVQAADRYNECADSVLKHLYPPTDNRLTTELDPDQRILVLHSFLLLLLSLEHYAAYSRILLLNLTASLHLPLAILSDLETATAHTLLAAADLNADAETEKKAHENTSARKWKVGLATAAGAALIGVTGGLAAPLVAAGVGSVMGGLGLGATAAAAYLGAVAESSIVIGSLFGAYGGRMTGKIMDQYAKDVDDFAFVPVHRSSSSFHGPGTSTNTSTSERDRQRLRVALGISGWLTDKEDVVKPWRVLAPSIQGLALRWELEALLRLGNAVSGMVRTTAWAYAKKELVKRSVFALLFSALWPLKIIRVASIVDNPFSVALARADKAGRVLADALANKVQGERPVTLIGYSLGARVIWSCLLQLARRNQFGLVESAVLLGGPLPSQAWHWRQMRAVVAGRLVNVHSLNDYILALLYRTSALEYGVAGLQQVKGVHGVENLDASDMISGHLRYRFLAGSILKKIGFEDLDVDMVEANEAEMTALEAMDEKVRKEREERDKKSGKGEDEEVKDLEKEVEKRNAASIMDWATAKLGHVWIGHDGDAREGATSTLTPGTAPAPVKKV